MRIMRVTALEGTEQTNGAIDLDRVTFAHPDGENTLVYINNDMSIRIAITFEQFLEEWSDGNVIPSPYKQRQKAVQKALEVSPELDRVIKGEA